MKKVLSVLLIAVCNSAAVFAVTILNLLVFFFTLSLPAAVLAGFIATIVLGFASSRFLRLLKLKTRWFMLVSYALPAVVAAVYWIVFFIHDSSGYFTGYFAGMGEFILGLSLAPTAFCYLIFGTFWCLYVRKSTD